MPPHTAYALHSGSMAYYLHMPFEILISNLRTNIQWTWNRIQQKKTLKCKEKKQTKKREREKIQIGK